MKETETNPYTDYDYKRDGFYYRQNSSKLSYDHYNMPSYSHSFNYGRSKSTRNWACLPVIALNPNLNGSGLSNLVRDRSVGRHADACDCQI